MRCEKVRCVDPLKSEQAQEKHWSADRSQPYVTTRGSSVITAVYGFYYNKHLNKLKDEGEQKEGLPRGMNIFITYCV